MLPTPSTLPVGDAMWMDSLSQCGMGYRSPEAGMGPHAHHTPQSWQRRGAPWMDPVLVFPGTLAAEPQWRRWQSFSVQLSR